MAERKKLVAYIAPMAAFLLLFSLNDLLKKADQSFWLTSAEYWVYPLQTVVCVALLWWFRREYPLRRPMRLSFGLGIGLLVFALWISPQMLFRYPPRAVGFNPDVFSDQPLLYWLTIIFRFLRLVVVVPLMEEIFWRGFLLRYLISENFDEVRFGTFSWVSFAVVALAFGFSHSSSDWAAAVLTGALYNWVAYRSKSLSTCVVTHAVTNLLLGLWIMQTKQWGFW